MEGYRDARGRSTPKPRSLKEGLSANQPLHTEQVLQLIACHAAQTITQGIQRRRILMLAYLPSISLLVGLVDSWVLYLWAVRVSNSSGRWLASMMGGLV